MKLMNSERITDVITDEALLIDEVLGAVKALRDETQLPAVLESGGLDSTSVAIRCLDQALFSVGANSSLRDGLDDDRFELAMSRAARIRRWVLACGAAPADDIDADAPPCTR